MSTRGARPCHDPRDWPECNESLVVRGEFYLDLGFLDGWEAELTSMNQGTRGSQFQIPESFVR